MIPSLLVAAAGVAVGFGTTRRLRRPDRAATAASVARNVSGTFGARRGLSAPELQRAAFSEMVRHVEVDRSGRTTVPGSFELSLHPSDLAVVDQARSWFVDGLVDALRVAADDHGWHLSGKVRIETVEDPSRRPGAPSATVTSASGPAAPMAAVGTVRADPGDGGDLALERSDTGERVPLTGDSVTIGRSRDRDVSIDDGRISRGHAHLERHQRGWFVVDDGSSNGTRVDGRALEPHRPAPIRNGMVIGVGPVDLRVRAARSGGAEPRSRALDDSDRNRISREYLPPMGGETW